LAVGEENKKRKLDIEQKPDRLSGGFIGAKQTNDGFKKTLPVDSLTKKYTVSVTEKHLIGKAGGSQRPSAPTNRNAIKQELLDQAKKDLRQAQGLSRQKPEDEYGGGPARRSYQLSKQDQDGFADKNDEIYSDFDGEKQSQQRRDGRAQNNGPVNDDSQKNQPEDGDNDDGSKDGPNIKNSIVNRATDYLKGKAKNFFSKEAKTAIVAFILEWWWAILLVILIIIGGFLAFSYFFGNAGRSPSETGQSIVQAADPIKDKAMIQKVLALSGNGTVNSQELQQLADELEAIKQYADDSTDQKIDVLINKIQKFNQLNKQNGTSIISSLKEIVSEINGCVEVATSDFFKFAYNEDEDTKKEILADKLKRQDGQTTQLDKRICRLLVTIENNKEAIGINDVSITALVDHKVYSGTRTHANGRAVDLDWRDDNDTKIIKWIFNNYDSLKQQGIAPYEVKEPFTQYLIAQDGALKGSDALSAKGFDKSSLQNHGWTESGTVGSNSHIHIDI